MQADDLPVFLADQLASVQGRLVLGFSGGLDSSVLLQALCRAGLGERLLAVHIHHGIHPDADQWLQHCQQQAERCAVAFAAQRVALAAGGNLEARARTARRAALLSYLADGDVLLLAHHRDDQAETLLLRLMRSSGMRGLAAMAARQSWQGRDILRPLLDWSRGQLETVAQQWQLSWIDDPANDELHFDRNFVRHRVLPAMAQRWPDGVRHIAMSASVLAEQAQLLDELAAADLVACDGDRDSLSLPLWSQLSPARRRNLLYGWLRQRGMRPPSADNIARIDSDMVMAADDRQPEVVWHDGELVRYRQRLWLLAPGQRAPLTDSALWQPASQPLLRLGPVDIRVTDGEGLEIRDAGQSLMVRAASGGERILLRGHHRQVSELWRSAGVPPWRRQRLPLFFVGDELVAVASIGVADGWSPSPGETAFRLLIEDSAL
ncbi:tRNA lysidine(34) synthetase TilS [Alcanivorax sp. 1008]|uniref:tRNA lysidine(34) synthetase TilS n=1 Tax=Alcanivorax sp. 1008 TaxID=2816853 RepID=UPI001DD06084|nr:tRNA lysidine(34) synthetase TilS [Alcanivorax sp. 1008]MCC1495564.1 tRNA lysidine(34) synthetase TilS [Alcanivorax sp. 1008]